MNTSGDPLIMVNDRFALVDDSTPPRVKVRSGLLGLDGVTSADDEHATVVIVRAGEGALDDVILCRAQLAHTKLTLVTNS